MIVRIQFLQVLPNGIRDAAYKWPIYSVDANKSFLNIFKGIRNGKLSCGSTMDLAWVDEVSVQIILSLLISFFSVLKEKKITIKV